MAEKSNQQTKNGKEISLAAKIEALLFVSPVAVSVRQLANSLDESPKNIEKALDKLDELFATRGIRVQKNQGKYQLTSAPEAAVYIENLLELDTSAKLSQAAVETLAVIAYQQPITRPGIDDIRGVNSDGVVRNLLSKGLIEEAGRSEGPGRPILYVTNAEFLQFFGLSSLKDLPPLDVPEVPPEIHVEVQKELPLEEKTAE